MTTYLDIQTAGRHMFPIESRGFSLLAGVSKFIAEINNDMARAKSQHELRQLSDHMLKDIGAERHLLDI